MQRIRIWDLPTRLVHWSLVALVAFSWWTAENGRMDWHRYSGYAVLGVLVFRIYWGIVGSDTARFAHFIKGPRAIAQYFRDKSLVVAGHNPFGALSVIALLVLLLTQVGLGLFAVDVDGLESGPLSHLVTFDEGREYAKSHEAVFNVLLAFIVLHIVAILFYLIVKRDNLIGPMITGAKNWATNVPQLKFASWWIALPGIAIAAAVVWYIA
jgi:cytochrome b